MSKFKKLALQTSDIRMSGSKTLVFEYDDPKTRDSNYAFLGADELGLFNDGDKLYECHTKGDNQIKVTFIRKQKKLDEKSAMEVERLHKWAKVG